MSTTAEHATTAASLLAAPIDSGDPDTRRFRGMQAAVHAVLSKSAGTGTDYTAAETDLDKFTATGDYAWYASALAHAHLA